MEAKDYVTELLAAGLTQTKIAERTGIPQPTISKVFRGDVDDVLSRNYRRLLDLHAEVVLKRNAPTDGATEPEQQEA